MLSLSSAFISRFPSESTKNPLLVVAVVEAFAKLPTFIEPAEFKVTTPPVSV